MRNYRLDENDKTVHLHMAVTKTWKARVAAYARRRRITRSEAIRRLVAEGLERVTGGSIPCCPSWKSRA